MSTKQIEKIGQNLKCMAASFESSRRRNVANNPSSVSIYESVCIKTDVCLTQRVYLHIGVYTITP